jgi:hypothetical protein
MSDFLKLLNGQYGMYYRKMEGGHGYVFQSRFKSTIIEDDGYYRDMGRETFTMLAVSY